MASTRSPIPLIGLCLGMAACGLPADEGAPDPAPRASSGVHPLAGVGPSEAEAAVAHAGRASAVAAEVGEPTYVVPSDGLPDRLFIQDANNNLDVTRHQGRTYLAFRTAPTHFASEHATMHIVSSADEITWDHEASISLGTDVREPRLLSWNGRLFLYFALLGTDWWDFEPQGSKVMEQLGPGRWTAPVDFGEPGFIPWRTKVVDGVPYMIAYDGGADIYDPGEAHLQVYWLTTSDGYSWEAVVPGQPVVLTGGCSETDFVIQDDGALTAVCRNEAGDADGWGSKVCRATPDAPGDWRCVTDTRKYDSPLMFRQGGRTWLVARRNLTQSGDYDLGLDLLPDGIEDLLYLVYYSLTPKRCALWEVDPDGLEVSFAADLPSNGDTCFPGVIADGRGAVEVYNYTSSTDLPDIPWIVGQLLPTSIYRVPVTLP